MNFILRTHGIEPATERKRHTTWKTFLKSHWDVLGAIDFTTIEIWTIRGLVTFYLLFVSKRVTEPFLTWGLSCGVVYLLNP